MTKQLLNSVIAKYPDSPVSRRSIIDPLTTDKWQYFAQPRQIIWIQAITDFSVQINSNVFLIQAAFEQTAQIWLDGNSSEAVVSDKE